VTYLGRLSTDRLGATHERMMLEDGVDLSATQRTDAPSTLALASLDEDGVASYSFYAAGTAAPGLTPAAALAALPLEVAALHVGTLGLVLEPLAAALEAVVARLAGRAMVVVDPNIRPWVIDAPDVYRARLEHVLQMTDLVKVSEEDLAWLDPSAPYPDAARALLSYGPKVVLLTQGPAGATIVTERGDFPVAPVPVDVVDTIGAGDAFSGGFLAWWSSHGLGREELSREGLVVEAARFAAVVAARTVGAAGASPPALPADAPMPLDLRSL
jgi:fructokinase